VIYWVYVFSFVFMFTKEACAFPDLIRHGYANCTTCHFSPAGGGVLNDYGRSLSKELISTWSAEGEEQVGHGLFKLSPQQENDLKFYIGGDARYLTRKTQTAATQTYEQFLMQTQLRVAAEYKKLKINVTLGKIENPRISSNVIWVSPEFYTQWSFKDDVYFRIGRFEPIYGLRMPDHNLWVKSEVKIVPWVEKDTFELIYEGETQFASLSGFQTDVNKTVANQNTGYAASFYQVIFEKYKLGFSTLSTEGQGQRVKSYDLNATVPFGEQAYWLLELANHSNSGQGKFLTFSRFGWEVFKGVIPVLQYQGYEELNGVKGKQTKAGLGMFWYPRPHFEFFALYEDSKGYRGDSKDLQILSHYYF